MNVTLILLAYFMTAPFNLYNFSSESNSQDWYIVDDDVMGGRSSGNFTINKDGHGQFSGTVSLENNGGFSSVRHRFSTKEVSSYSKFVLRVKGDGKTYQFRAKIGTRDYASYIYEFQTTTDWITIEIPFSEMYPSFRGRKLNQPNYEGNYLSEMAFLIGNKKPQEFKLLIDSIVLK